MPSEFLLPPTAEKIVVLNNSSFFSIDSSANKLMHTLDDNEILILDTIATINLFKGFFSVIDESPLENLINSEYIEIRRVNGKQLPEPLNEDEVIFFSSDHEADAVITLEFFDLEIDYSHKRYYENSLNAGVDANISLNRQALWRIYDKEGGVLDELTQNDTLYWSSTDYYEAGAYEGLPMATEVVRNSFYTMGQDYAKRISPYWLSVYRVYYPIKEMGRIDYSLDKDYLLKLTEHRNKRKAYKASFNLAYISEKEDDLRSALRWLEIAEFLNPSSPYAEKYRKVIEERIAAKDKLW